MKCSISIKTLGERVCVIGVVHPVHPIVQRIDVVHPPCRKYTYPEAEGLTSALRPALHSIPRAFPSLHQVLLHLLFHTFQHHMRLRQLLPMGCLDRPRRNRLQHVRLAGADCAGQPVRLHDYPGIDPGLVDLGLLDLPLCLGAQVSARCRGLR